MVTFAFIWIFFQIKKWRYPFVAFLCNMWLAFSTSHSSIRASQKKTLADSNMENDDSGYQSWYHFFFMVIVSITYVDILIMQLDKMYVWQKTFICFWANTYVKRNGIIISLALAFWFCLHSQSQIIIFHVAVQN